MGANLYAEIRSTVETARSRSITAIQASRLNLEVTMLPRKLEKMAKAFAKIEPA